MQVSLIILSLLVAVGVDRCNQGVKNDRKLDTYLTSINEEFEYELETCRNNLYDCQKDIEGLSKGALLLSKLGQTQQSTGIAELAQVLIRGVFRSFSPTSFELMVSAGDAFLIDDLELRSDLASIVAFRNDYVKRDLWRHDELTLSVIAEVAEYIDLECLRTTPPEAFPTCITNPEKMQREIAADLAEIAHHSQTRHFHLGRYETRLEYILPPESELLL